tara:strand:- start:597 stop:785 length:189 start_codon:yes stop_codon:yes gene_type:complete
MDNESGAKKDVNKYSEAGKGDARRMGISPFKWTERWEKIFGKRDAKEKNDASTQTSGSQVDE